MIQYEDRQYMISTLIKLVAEEDVEKICRVAKHLQKTSKYEHILDMPDRVVYELYTREE